MEQASAFKKKHTKTQEAIERAKREKKVLVFWRYDRAFRNMKDFVSFMTVMYEYHKIKVYSVNEEWVNMLWDIMESLNLSNVPEPWDEIIKEQMKGQWKQQIKLIGYFAEEESKKKSQRVKSAVRINEGITKSYKGNKWGRKSLTLDSQIIELYKNGKSMRNITKEIFYWDKNNHKKFVSIGYVHKVLNVHKFISKNKEVKELANSKIHKLNK